MPNYCENYLVIEGNDDTKKLVMEFVQSEESLFDFEKIVPMPDYIYRGVVGAKEKEIYGENNWYDWSNKNWGTKWNSDEAVVWDDEFHFLTAWTPCDPIITALAEKFPTARFTYTFYETGMAFCGKRVYENGKLVFYYDGDYAVNYDCEYDECEYYLADTLFPIKDSGFTKAVDNVENHDGIVRGVLHFREYTNNRIYQMTDGDFVATEDYTKRLANFQTFPLTNAA